MRKACYVMLADAKFYDIYCLYDYHYNCVLEHLVEGHKYNVKRKSHHWSILDSIWPANITTARTSLCRMELFSPDIII